MRFGNKNEGEPENFPDLAKKLVQRQYNETGIGTPRGETINPLKDDEVYVVWFAYVLGHWKALVSTMRPDDRYYEVTYHSERKLAFVDTYLKTHNTAVDLKK
jgi:hypothetical protein